VQLLLQAADEIGARERVGIIPERPPPGMQNALYRGDEERVADDVRGAVSELIRVELGDTT